LVELKKVLAKNYQKFSDVEYFPFLANTKLDKKKVLKEYNKSLRSNYKNTPLLKLYRMSLLGKVNNFVKRDELFKEILSLKSEVLKFTLSDFCFNFYAICTQIRSSVFSNILNVQQVKWFEENISNQIWKMENPFDIKFFTIEIGNNRELMMELFSIYEINKPKNITELNSINLKREFFNGKLKSKSGSLLDIFYLFELGDKNIDYFRYLNK